MPNAVTIENIEDMRFLEGIDDVELREEISGLQVGDFVRLTFHCETSSFETLRVRITSIRGDAFRGELAKKPTSNGLSKLCVGSPLTFTADHIHSIAR